MNCEDFLAAQETGGPLARLRARGHAARCPRCAALRATFAGVKQELAHPDALSARGRQRWTDAAREPVSQRSPSRNWIIVTGGLATAACVVVLVLKLAGHKPADGPHVLPPPPIAVVTPPTVTESRITVIDPADNLAQLSQAANRLDAELKALRLEAERMDVRRQVAMTLERFDKW